jgi:hypothetical protein
MMHVGCGDHETKNEVRDYLAAIGKRGGLASRRELTRSHAKQSSFTS